MVKGRKPPEAPEAKEPDRAAGEAASPDRAPHDEGKVSGKQEPDKASPVAELERATTELARLDGILAGFRGQAAVVVETTGRRLETDDPSIPGDEVGVLHDLVQDMWEGVQSLAGIMQRLATVDDPGLDVIGRLVAHLAARATGNVNR